VKESPLLSITLVLLVAGCASQSPLCYPDNLTQVKEILTEYHDSGEYAEGMEVVADRARKALPALISTARPGTKPAIVFDIDETVLSNWQFISSNDYGLPAKEWQAFQEKAINARIQPTYLLYREALKNDVAVFLITGRRTPERAATTQNLRRAGFDAYDGLFLRPVSDDRPSVIPYKSGTRRSIEEDGYTIVLNIGDQWSDLEGGSAVKTFKLPNPFYFIP